MSNKQEEKNAAWAAVKTIADQVATAMQYLISIGVLIIIFTSLAAKFGLEVKLLPVVTEPLDLLYYALVVAVLTGRISLGK